MSKFPVRETITLLELENTGRSVTDVVMARKAELGADWYKITRKPEAEVVTVVYHNNDEEFPGDGAGVDTEEKNDE